MGCFFGMQIKGTKEAWIKESAKNRMSWAGVREGGIRRGDKDGLNCKNVKGAGGKRAKVFKGLVELQLQLQGGPEHGCFQRARSLTDQQVQSQFAVIMQ